MHFLRSTRNRLSPPEPNKPEGVLRSQETLEPSKDGYRIGHLLAYGVLQLQVLDKQRFVPMLAVKAKIRSMLAMECIAEAA